MINLRTKTIYDPFKDRTVIVRAADDEDSHDLAVAHALVKAIEENTLRQPINRVHWAVNPTSLLERAAEILKSDFGIEP